MQIAIPGDCLRSISSRPMRACSSPACQCMACKLTARISNYIVKVCRVTAASFSRLCVYRRLVALVYTDLYRRIVEVSIRSCRRAVRRLHRSVDLDTCIYVVVGFTYCFRHTLAVDYSLWINYSCRDGDKVQRVRLQKRLRKLCRS